MHTDILVDDNLLYLMETSPFYKSEHEAVAWIRGQRRTINVTRPSPCLVPKFEKLTVNRLKELSHTDPHQLPTLR